MAQCAECGRDNPAGAKFCASCGRALSLACPSCGSPYGAGDRFCTECGTTLSESAPSHVPAPSAAAPIAERRLVSVLFADLVGFTSHSESRDPEEVRELLSRYFDNCRRLVELYGGTVEKFIGDAVMAVWGTPTAQEDDAERAVRTALDLVTAVAALGDEVGAPDLRARAGVLTGEAAVNLGVTGQGMVAGDLVNTASRIQAAAAPGTVLVGIATRRASEAAVVYEEAGEHELKGKAEPVPLYRAVRVAAARGGALRSTGLEAPFVGRERELRLVKELFHASAEQGRAQLVSIVGIAGIGKSRLAWEFFKYLDGLAEEVWWHRGRCLAYGEGVAYWALAEMVRTRAKIVEGEERAAARAKLAACLEQHLPDAEERAWVEPRLANLLGLEERVDADRQDLFGAWRLFFERLADRNPVVLVFEDLQWADQALLAFVEYLLEWSAGRRLYVLALTRPELAADNPDFGRSVRNAATLALEPLSDCEMTELLDGYVPGLPPEVKQRVLDRAQGVPLYAVETVRMLLDRGLLVEEESVYRPTGEIGTLEMPESLHALAAARLDGLSPDERRLVQDGAVLGKTFTKPALASLTGLTEAALDPLLAGLIRKEVLSLQADPRMPERGQYAFLQELLREVAYETLARRDRKARHLAAVEALERSIPGAEQEVPEVIATHLLSAHDAAPADTDAKEIALRARQALAQAGERAASLAAADEGQRYLDRAAELADDETGVRAGLLMRAGALAFRSGRIADARARLEEAVAIFERLGETLSAARAIVVLADVDHGDGQLEAASRRLSAAVKTLEQGGPSEELAATLAQLGRMDVLRGELENAAVVLERALRLAENLGLVEVLVQAFISKGVLLLSTARFAEAELLLEGALRRADAPGLDDAWWRAANNLAVLLEDMDRSAEVVALVDELEARAQQRGNREQFVSSRLGSLRPLIALGRWDEALARLSEHDGTLASRWARSELVEGAIVFVERGQLADARTLLADEKWMRDAEQSELPACYAVIEARLLRAEGRPAEALASAKRGLAYREQLGMAYGHVKHSLAEALEAALDLGDAAEATELLGVFESLQPGELTPYLRGQRLRFRARVDPLLERDGAIEEALAEATETFAQFGLIFHRAVTELERAEWLIAQSRREDAEPLLTAARETFASLEARPWLERLEAATAGARTKITA